MGEAATRLGNKAEGQHKSQLPIVRARVRAQMPNARAKGQARIRLGLEPGLVTEDWRRGIRAGTGGEARSKPRERA